jgi:hypothetical protein
MRKIVALVLVIVALGIGTSAYAEHGSIDPWGGGGTMMSLPHH